MKTIAVIYYHGHGQWSVGGRRVPTIHDGAPTEIEVMSKTRSLSKARKAARLFVQQCRWPYVFETITDDDVRTPGFNQPDTDELLRRFTSGPK